MWFIRFLRTLLMIFLAIVIVFFALNAYVLISTRDMIIEPGDTRARGADCILVLGASVIGNSTPSAMLEDRLITACAVYGGTGVPLLMSGDSRDPNYDEVNVMAEYACSLGVPQEGVMTDPRGLSTYDSVVRAKTEYGFDEIVIVTQRYHLSRALFIAKANGIKAVGVVSDLREYQDAGKNVVREFFARVKDVVSVWLKLDSSNIELF